MNTLKEQQVTSLSELLKNAKRAEQTIEQNPSSKENAIDRAVKRLNTLFEKYWTPLFDEDKKYPLWNDGLSIYFGQGKGDYLRLEQTPINKIVLVNSCENNRTTYPESITKSYNKILYMIVIYHMYKDFKKEVDFSEIMKERKFTRHIESFNDLILMIKGLVFDNSFNRNYMDNTIEVKGKSIEIFPKLGFAMDYYYKLNSNNVNERKNYINDNNELSEILFKNLMTHQDNLTGFKKSISQLVQAYSEICAELLSDSDIQEIKKQFISLCKKYDLDSKNYLLSVNNCSDNKLTFSVKKRGNWEYSTIEEYLKNNSNYSALRFKEKGASFDYQSLEKEIKAHALEKLEDNFAQKFYVRNKSKIDELKKVKHLHKRNLKFGKGELSIFISQEYSVFQIIHNNCKFHCLFNDNYTFTIDSYSLQKELLDLSFEEIQKILEASAEVIEKFINS